MWSGEFLIAVAEVSRAVDYDERVCVPGADLPVVRVVLTQVFRGDGRMRCSAMDWRSDSWIPKVHRVRPE